MRRLELNPQNHDIIAQIEEMYKGEYASINLKFGSENEFNSCALNEKEAEKLGRWFLDLSKQLKPRKKTKKS